MREKLVRFCYKGMERTLSEVELGKIYSEEPVVFYYDGYLRNYDRRIKPNNQLNFVFKTKNYWTYFPTGKNDISKILSNGYYPDGFVDCYSFIGNDLANTTELLSSVNKTKYVKKEYYNKIRLMVTDNYIPNPEVDAGALFKLGDVVCVLPFKNKDLDEPIAHSSDIYWG